MTNCEACGANLIWAQTDDDKLMMLDAEPIRAGNILLDQSRVSQPRLALATVLGARAALEARDAGRTLYRSHFQSCPHAANFRKGKKR